MTTAHRPTWNPVTGGRDQGGNRVLVQSRQYSSKDLPGHTSLKFRGPGQGGKEEIKEKNFKAELLRKETENQSIKKSEELEDIEDSEIDEENKHLESSVEDDSSESSDFSEEELRREIEKIKTERAENEKNERAKLEEKNAKNEEIINGNPLLDISSGFSLKRKWTEETIFRNQCRDEPKEKIRFVNDTVRSDFHRKILRKYIL